MLSRAQDKETRTRSQQVVYALHTAGAAMRGLSCLTRQKGIAGLAEDLVRDLDTAVVRAARAGSCESRSQAGDVFPSDTLSWLSSL